MSSIAGLPDDLLRVIFILSSDTSVDQKFAVSQVSARWRLVALSTPHLWSRFCLHSERDFRRINLVLLRTSTSVALEAEMVGPFFMANHSSHLDEAMSALVPYAARLRALSTVRASGALLGNGLVFAILDTLRVKGPRDGRGAHLDLSTPALKHLDLELVGPLKLEQLLSSRIESLRLFLCAEVEAADILLVFARCHALVELTFHVDDSDDGSTRFGPIEDSPRMPNLERLDLRLSLGHMEDVLGAFCGLPPVAHVAAAVRGKLWEEIARLSAAIVPGLAPLVAFETDYTPTIILRDAGGRVRSMRMSRVRASYDVFELWAHLAEHYDMHRTVRDIVVPIDWWPSLVNSIQLHPLQSTSGVRLCLVTGADTGIIVVDLLPEPEIVPIPGLERIEFADGDGGEAGPAPEVIVSILRSIAWSGEEKLEVVLDKTFPAPARAHIERENRGRWRLVC